MDKSALWYINGHWVHPDEASISINDVAVLRGYSVFESFRTYHRRPFHLNEHLERLYRSAALIELDVPYTFAEMSTLMHEIIARNDYQHAAIRILVTGGISEDGITPPPADQPGLAILITPLPERDMERFARGIKVITSCQDRVVPEAKTTSYIAAIRALKAASRSGASDALFVNAQGQVLEGTRSNFFIFRGDTLVTPRESVLLGVTRNAVLQLARERFPIVEGPIAFDELSQAEEAFITSSSKEITPVIQIDEHVIGNGKPGPRTSALEQAFIAMIERGEF